MLAPANEHQHCPRRTSECRGFSLLPPSRLWTYASGAARRVYINVAAGGYHSSSRTKAVGGCKRTGELASPVPTYSISHNCLGRYVLQGSDWIPHP